MRTQSNILRAINKKINSIKLLFIITLIFQCCICYQLTNTKPIQEIKQADIFENLSTPPKIIPELEGIDLETVVKHESI